jgi:hypothetical protein
LTSDFIDPLSDSGRITATRKQAAAAEDLQAKYGDAVSVEFSESTPEAAANWMDGGDAINGPACPSAARPTVLPDRRLSSSVRSSDEHRRGQRSPRTGRS